jgi:hypothetical protein
LVRHIFGERIDVLDTFADANVSSHEGVNDRGQGVSPNVRYGGLDFVLERRHFRGHLKKGSAAGGQSMGEEA